MVQLRVTTFNVENLFNRYAFLDIPWANRNYEKFVEAVGLVSIASRQGDLVSYETTDIQRNNTANAILEAAPDILALQEIENIYTLRNFNETYLDNYFDRIISIDGNDPRGIDVGFMIKEGVKVEILNVRTHIDEPEKGKTIRRTAVLNQGYIVKGAIFSRDCLEVDVKIGGKTLTFLINHLKAQDQTPESKHRRKRQADRVAELAKKAATDGKLPIVMGDLNTDPKKTPSDNSLDALLKSNPILRDPFPGKVPPKELWTHYYTFGKEVSRLDYVLLHKDLTVTDVDIVRKGLTTKCKQYTGQRYPTIGPEHTEASDHCPTTVVLEL